MPAQRAIAALRIRAVAEHPRRAAEIARALDAIAAAARRHV